MTFHKQPESLGFSFICFVTTPSQPLSTHTLLRTLNNLYVDQALELLVFSASLRHSSLVFINTLSHLLRRAGAGPQLNTFDSGMLVKH